MVKLIKGPQHKVNKVGGGVGCSRPGACNGGRPNIEEDLETELQTAIQSETPEQVKEYLEYPYDNHFPSF